MSIESMLTAEAAYADITLRESIRHTGALKHAHACTTRLKVYALLSRSYTYTSVVYRMSGVLKAFFFFSFLEMGVFSDASRRPDLCLSRVAVPTCLQRKCTIYVYRVRDWKQCMYIVVESTKEQALKTVTSRV